MRWARVDRNGTPTFALVEGEDVVLVEGTPFDGWERTAEKIPIAEAQLLVPVIPPTFYACGSNYEHHIRVASARRGVEPVIPTRPEVGYRAVNALLPHGEPIIIPKDASDEVVYEGELVVVIGKKAKNLTREDALSCVLGYTIGNDISQRTWQSADRTFWRSKNADTFKPMGPWIETELDLDNLVTRVSLNGEIRSEFKTNGMLFGVVDYLVEMTRYLTVYPGDVIWMGTDGENHTMKDGDTIDIEINDIGTLTNPIVREKS